MVRKPASKPASKQEEQPTADPRERIVDALMRLAAERPWREIEIGDVAREAGMSLAELRDHVPSKGAILALFSRMIDRKVLEGTSEELAEEPPRDRLFDVMMRRIDALTPYKPALKRIARALRTDPLALAAFNRVALNSQRYMLAAANIGTEGSMGALRLQGAVCVFARVLDTWFEDDDVGLARTMARLDRELRRGERLLVCAEDIHRLTAPLRAVARLVCEGPREARRRFRERARDTTRHDEDGEDYAPAI
ncbi:TetR/AcrR family transcriptional regulator [Chelatococcus sp. SYSU_G07232]|uniref:TetR/AcrR family transcriptional regulator n=1 Tax=Chelatococcus albus TaxID=3047466 RepID=A0ABT7AIU5_9HYPH|nr:TetR/AcrR family transcriptional regulator [Chelatococcus sp. SYSU_G07232]MDJ1159289.1 TetR/AcrR family transcriptional regulator [Chelatococcus sp. SYSU_G07232]